MQLNPNIPIIVTSLIAAMGLVAKTKEDDKNQSKSNKFNKLTTLGYILFALLLISTAASFWSQHDKDVQTKIVSDSLDKKAERDSLKALYEAAVAEKRHLEVTSGLSQTIDVLKSQIKYDSELKRQDSAHFMMTLKKFNEQLLVQNKSLTEISKVIHPFFPFEISVKLEYPNYMVSTNDLVIIKEFFSMLLRSRDRKYILRYPPANNIMLRYEYDSDREENDTLAVHARKVIEQFVPEIDFLFCKEEKPVLREDSTISFFCRATPFIKAEMKNNRQIMSEISSLEGGFSIRVIYSNFIAQAHANFNSLLEIPNGVILMQPSWSRLTLSRDNSLDFVSRIEFRCGNTYKDLYTIPEISSLSLRKRYTVFVPDYLYGEYKYYTVKVSDVLK